MSVAPGQEGAGNFLREAGEDAGVALLDRVAHRTHEPGPGIGPVVFEGDDLSEHSRDLGVEPLLGLALGDLGLPGPPGGTHLTPAIGPRLGGGKEVSQIKRRGRLHRVGGDPMQ